MNRRGFIGALFGGVAAVAINMRMAKGMPELEEVDAWAERATLSHPDMDDVILDDVVFPSGYTMQVSNFYNEFRVGEYLSVSSLGLCKITQVDGNWITYERVPSMLIKGEEVLTFHGHYGEAYGHFGHA